MANGAQRSAEHEEAMENFNEAREAAIEAYANLLDAKRNFTMAARAAGVEMKESTQEHIEEAYQRARQRGERYQADVQDYVHEHPLASAGMLFAAGFIFSRLMK